MINRPNSENWGPGPGTEPRSIQTIVLYKWCKSSKVLRPANITFHRHLAPCLHRTKLSKKSLRKRWIRNTLFELIHIVRSPPPPPPHPPTKNPFNSSQLALRRGRCSDGDIDRGGRCPERASRRREPLVDRRLQRGSTRRTRPRLLRDLLHLHAPQQAGRRPDAVRRGVDRRRYGRDGVTTARRHAGRHRGGRAAQRAQHQLPDERLRDVPGDATWLSSYNTNFIPTQGSNARTKQPTKVHPAGWNTKPRHRDRYPFNHFFLFSVLYYADRCQLVIIHPMAYVFKPYAGGKRSELITRRPRYDNRHK